MGCRDVSVSSELYLSLPQGSVGPGGTGWGCTFSRYSWSPGPGPEEALGLSGCPCHVPWLLCALGPVPSWAPALSGQRWASPGSLGSVGRGDQGGAWCRVLWEGAGASALGRTPGDCPYGPVAPPPRPAACEMALGTRGVGTEAGPSFRFLLWGLPLPRAFWPSCPDTLSHPEPPWHCLVHLGSVAFLSLSASAAARPQEL